MFLCCQDVILNQVQNKVQDLVAYSDFFRDNIQLFVSDSGVAKEKTNALLFEMDKLVPLFVELNAQNKDCSKALCNFKDGFIKLGNVMGKVGLVEYAAKIFSSIFMLCSKEEKEQIKHQVPLILLSDIPESEFEYAEKMMIANAFDDICDYEHAFKWYESAVEKYRVREAGYKIGTYYENGYAVEKDVPKAYEWYERAAWSGNRESIIKLARTYYYGSLYVSKDYEKAKKYLIQLFVDTPEKSLEEWLNINFPGWKTDENDAYSHLSSKRSKELVELANLGIAAASYWLGVHYYGEYWTSGFYGYKENKALSRRWYLEAALTDYAPAIDELKERFRIEIARITDGEKMFLTACNYSEDGSEQEKDLRFYWLRKAVDYGYEDACNLLGICYDEAIGTTCDYEKANKLYLRAIEYNENSGAHYNYAVNLYFGNGCKKNLKRAKKYFWIACEKGIEPAIECLKEYYGIDYIKEKQPSNYFLSKRPWYYPKTFCSETLIDSVCSNENFEEIRIYDNYGLMVEFGGYEIFEENVYLKIMVNNSTGHICYFWLEDMFVNGERQNRHTELEECEADYEWHCYKIKIEKAAADYYNNIEFTTAVSNQYGNSLGKADRVIAKILCPENEIFVQII
jgi:TPR repeat protein